jgi:hypothetical protein
MFFLVKLLGFLFLKLLQAAAAAAGDSPTTYIYGFSAGSFRS